MQGPSESTHFRSRPSTLAEINVIPLVDIMLVLLIVFMVSAPMLTQGIDIQLPQAEAGAISEAPKQITLVISAGSDITLDGTAVPRGQLQNQLKEMAGQHPDLQVLVEADRRVNYDIVARVLAAVKQAQVHQVGLVTLGGSSAEEPI
jgi:biopolymer transport protein TolR